MRKVALLANLVWICLILARFTMNGGQVHEPKLMTRGILGLATLKRETFVLSESASDTFEILINP